MTAKSKTNYQHRGGVYLGYDIADYSDRTTPDRLVLCMSYLAPQPGLGLRSQQLLGTGTGDCVDTFALVVLPRPYFDMEIIEVPVSKASRLR